MKTIDIHTHIGFLNNDFYNGEELYKLLRKNNIQKAFISSTSGGTINQGYGNKEVYNFIKKHSGMFLGQIWINPYDPNWKKDAKKYLNKNFIGIKLHSCMNRYRAEFKFLKPVFEFAKRHELTIFTHTEEEEWHSAENYESLAKNFPSVKIILYHMAPVSQAISLAKKYKNVFLETSNTKISDIKKAVKKCGAEKVLFGSDTLVGSVGFPTIKSGSKKKSYYSLIKSFQKNFKKENCEKILYKNAKEIFDIK